MGWNAFDNGRSIGQFGSENGVIVRDDEHDAGARITLEKNAQHAPVAITCGIYGWMVHTRFLGSETQAQSDYETMKDDLSKILNMVPLKADPESASKSQLVADSLSAFVKKFP